MFQMYRLLASLGLIWSPGSMLTLAIDSMIYSLLGIGRIRNAIAQDHTTEVSLKVVFDGHWLWIIRKMAAIGVSRGKVDLRPCWQTGKVIVPRHSIRLSRGRIVDIGSRGSLLCRRCWQVDTRLAPISIGYRSVVTCSVLFEACHGGYFVGLISDGRV